MKKQLRTLLKLRAINRKAYLIAVSSVVLLSFIVGSLFMKFAPSKKLAGEPADKVISVESEYPFTIGPGSTLYSVLLDLNIPGPTIHGIVEGAKPVIQLSKIKPGTRFNLSFKKDNPMALEKIKFRMSPVDIVEISENQNVWVAHKLDIKVETTIISFAGSVTTTLWESAEVVNMDTSLIPELAEIFAWQVDFAREVRVGDRWRMVVEQKLVKGQPIGWGRITSAEYENAGHLYSAVLFRHNGEDHGYFAPDGTSLRKMFLKSPIRFGRISSTFQRARFHPILKVHRPHLGVDYAAPKGTPVHAVGNGVVTSAGWSGGGGNTLRIRHNATYATAYLHLSGFASGIKKGTKVQQGQVVAYVGSTGLSTASHLHFEFYENGNYINPQSKKFPSAEPVPKELMEEFKELSRPLLASLPPWGASVTTLDDSADAVQELSN
jgi:murein DD-endopeptidase MepM/ murein hydrolase activator NlpD